MAPKMLLATILKMANIYIHIHDVHHKFGNGFEAQQAHAYQHMVFIVARHFILNEIVNVSANGDKGCSIVSQIFYNSTDGR